MKKYFINPELKKSSVVIIFIMSAYFIVNSLIMKAYHENLKASYIKSLGAITNRVIEVNPELEKEIIPIITKEVTKEEGDKGRVLLSQYGLTEVLEDELFPYLSEESKRDRTATIVSFISISTLIFLLNYGQHVYFYKRIRGVTYGAKKVIEGDYDFSIEEFREGDFSKLAIAFKSMKEVIRNNINALNKEKQFLADLLSDISHQLKTPLSSMIIYNDIMLSKDLSIEQRKNFLINNQNQLLRMEWLIKSLLKLAKLDAKAVEFNKENLTLSDTIEDSIEALESMANDKSISIRFTKKAEVTFSHDKLWLEEALLNIIKNCIEHTDKNGIVNIELSENPVYKRIIIEDTGEGISEEDLPNIFKRFYKAKTNKNSTSVGIGLALAKSIVEAHNGMIEVKSSLNIGSKFIITFINY